MELCKWRHLLLSCMHSSISAPNSEILHKTKLHRTIEARLSLPVVSAGQAESDIVGINVLIPLRSSVPPSWKTITLPLKVKGGSWKRTQAWENFDWIVPKMIGFSWNLKPNFHYKCIQFCETHNRFVSSPNSVQLRFGFPRRIGIRWRFRIRLGKDWFGNKWRRKRNNCSYEQPSNWGPERYGT